MAWYACLSGDTVHEHERGRQDARLISVRARLAANRGCCVRVVNVWGGVAAEAGHDVDLVVGSGVGQVPAKRRRARRAGGFGGNGGICILVSRILYFSSFFFFFEENEEGETHQRHQTHPVRCVQVWAQDPPCSMCASVVICVHLVLAGLAHGPSEIGGGGGIGHHAALVGRSGTLRPVGRRLGGSAGHVEQRAL